MIAREPTSSVDPEFYSRIDAASETWIYGCGLAGQWLARQFDSRCKNFRGFIDTDEKKSGMLIDGHKVHSPKGVFGPGGLAKKDALIVISVIDIKDVLDLLHCFDVKVNYVPLGKHINVDSREMVENSESEQFLSYALSAVEECHKGFLDPKRLFLRSVDLIITERCSLKCRDCSNLMQYYSSPRNLSFEEIVRDFDRLMAGVDHVFEIRLIGGEPFMNKDIYRVLEHIITTPNISRVVIYTNAMVPINLKYAALLQDKRIVFSITNYGELANRTPEVISQIEDLGVTFRQSPPVNWTDSGTILSKKISAASAQDLFEKCCGKNLLTLSDGKLYRCPFAANGERLGAFSSEDVSGVSLSARKFEIDKYVSDRQHIAACKYCKGRSFDSPEIIPAVQVKSPIDYVRA